MEAEERVFRLFFGFTFEIGKEKVAKIEDFLLSNSGTGIVFEDDLENSFYPNGLRGRIVRMEVKNGYSLLTIHIQTPLSCSNIYGETYRRERIPVNGIKYLPFMKNDYFEQLKSYSDYCDEFLKKLSFTFTISYSGRKYFFEIDDRVEDFQVVSFPCYEDIKYKNFHKFGFSQEEVEDPDRIVFEPIKSKRILETEDIVLEENKKKNKIESNVKKKKKRKKIFIERAIRYVLKKKKKKKPTIIHSTYQPSNQLNFREYV